MELLFVFSSNNIVDCKCEVLVAWQVSKIVTQGLQLVFWILKEYYFSSMHWYELFLQFSAKSEIWLETQKEDALNIWICPASISQNPDFCWKI